MASLMATKHLATASASIANATAPSGQLNEALENQNLAFLCLALPLLLQESP